MKIKVLLFSSVNYENYTLQNSVHMRQSHVAAVNLDTFCFFL